VDEERPGLHPRALSATVHFHFFSSSLLLDRAEIGTSPQFTTSDLSRSHVKNPTSAVGPSEVSNIPVKLDEDEVGHPLDRLWKCDDVYGKVLL